jgi:hypothetical protein
MGLLKVAGRKQRDLTQYLVASKRLGRLGRLKHNACFLLSSFERTARSGWCLRAAVLDYPVGTAAIVACDGLHADSGFCDIVFTK